MTTPYFDLGCCALTAAERALTEHNIPLPGIRQFIAHEPQLDCSCDALYVQVGPARATTEERIQGPGGGGYPGGVGVLPRGCIVQTSQVEVTIQISRCVHVVNPLNDECWPPGDCTTEVACPGAVVPERERGLCAAPAASKAQETAWLLEDRWVMETTFVEQWGDCLCEGWCGNECPDWPQIGCHANPQWQSSEPFDGGGCGGTILRYTIDWP